MAAGKDQRKKEALIDFCIKPGRKVREERNKKKKQITEVMLGRQREKGRVLVDVKERNRVTKEVQKVVGVWND